MREAMRAFPVSSGTQARPVTRHAQQGPSGVLRLRPQKQARRSAVPQSRNSSPVEMGSSKTTTTARGGVRPGQFRGRRASWALTRRPSRMSHCPYTGLGSRKPPLPPQDVRTSIERPRTSYRAPPQFLLFCFRAKRSSPLLTLREFGRAKGCHPVIIDPPRPNSGPALLMGVARTALYYEEKAGCVYTRGYRLEHAKLQQHSSHAHDSSVVSFLFEIQQHVSLNLSNVFIFSCRRKWGRFLGHVLYILVAGTQGIPCPQRA